MSTGPDAVGEALVWTTRSTGGGTGETPVQADSKLPVLFGMAKPKLPRVPLPRQTGGAHKTRRNELARKAKHKGGLRESASAESRP